MCMLNMMHESNVDLEWSKCVCCLSSKKNRPCSYFIQSTIRNEAKWVRNSKIQIDNKIAWPLKSVSSLESLPQKALGVKKNSITLIFFSLFPSWTNPLYTILTGMASTSSKCCWVEVCTYLQFLSRSSSNGLYG